MNIGVGIALVWSKNSPILRLFLSLLCNIMEKFQSFRVTESQITRILGELHESFINEKMFNYFDFKFPS